MNKKIDTKELIKYAKSRNFKYHGTKRFTEIFFPHISQYFEVFKGSRVVDVGANSGIFSFEISNYADHCYAVEILKECYEDILATKDKFPEANVTPVLSDIGAFDKNSNYDYDAIFAANVLYHLDEKSVQFLEKNILPRCKKVLFISKENKPKKKNSYNLYSYKSIINFLEKNGFKAKRLDGNKEIFKDYKTDYIKNKSGSVNREVEKTHTDSVLIPIYGEKV